MWAGLIYYEKDNAILDAQYSFSKKMKRTSMNAIPQMFDKLVVFFFGPLINFSTYH